MDPVLLIPHFPRPTLWLDAAMYLTDDAGTPPYVTSWKSKINQSHDFTAAGADMPLYLADGINGRPAAEWTNGVTTMHLRYAGAVLTGTTGCLFAVCKRYDSAATGYCYGQGRTGNNTYWGALGFYTNAKMMHASAVGADAVVLYGDDAASDATDYVAYYELNSTGRAMRLSNDPQTIGATEPVWFGSVTSQDASVIGARLAGATISSPFRGRIAEIVAYDRVIGTMEREQVMRYLAGKYGLTLA